ncbi:MAG: MBL fold metallo-hydrolase [Deltaproteobacteria bacterium]|nr:MBL fold metallo-hydrolase [Deltaproteobacteria bacterium]
MEIKAFFDKQTFTMTYVLSDRQSGDAVVIDPVLDYDQASSSTSTGSVQVVTDYLKSSGLNPLFIMETHAHADHLSGSQVLKEAYPQAQVGIGKRITEVQRTFKGLFNLGEDFPTDGSQFDRLFEDEETVQAGSLSFRVINTPGHTPADVSYLFGDALFTGDTMFMPDGGTGRCDFPAGSAEDLYDSITRRLYALPDETRVFVGHDYQPGGRELRYQTSIGEAKRENVQLPQGRSREEFVEFRKSRDSTLSAPRLIFPSVQVNIDAGRLPAPSSNNVRYLKIPLNLFARS